MSTIKVSAIQDLSGGTDVDVPNGAKAWVNFNGTGTVAIRADYNVTSITDTGSGQYTVNFTNAISDTNYCIVAMLCPDASTETFAGRIPSKTTSSVALIAFNIGGSGTDTAQASVAIFR